MNNENNTQRPSPSSPDLLAETHLKAGEGLDETACSASSNSRERALKAVELVNKMRDKYNEAEKHPKGSDEYTNLFNEGREYLAHLQSI